ncbi:DHH family phosphoesterase [Paenibacillus thermoaerophilus]|uniref:Cyclic-di-AMP phosphodiesterase n=1 Tax=Paenibacillus thermoaerophilus TaxID=1215385 RepID=A0ABW2V7Q1_9BACL|nr:DHH family phosphoesterase [Paenibacillus thermoaerophilus]TMV06623.1 hypothetical protein FE781_16750 [Paenibacillus thermoaerophilus]
MAHWWTKQKQNRHLAVLFGLLALLAGLLAFYDWRPAAGALALIAFSVWYVVRHEKQEQKMLQRYVATISHRVKKAGTEVFNELPIGIVLYDESGEIEWHNPFVSRIFDTDSLIGRPLTEVFPGLRNKKDKDGKHELEIESKVYLAQVKAEERLVYITDITQQSVLQKRYEEEKLSIGLVVLDNLDEVSQGMDDQTRSLLMAKVTGEITNWANKYGMLLRRTSSDRFLLLLNQQTLKALEASRFEILDDVRELTSEQKVPLTLSIGVSAGFDKLTELGQMAQMSLDMALGRGGDQAAVKVGPRMSFYGGKSNAVEKRTRVRARVISHALRDLIRESDKVVIMGHRNPDLDSLGAAIGVLKAVHLSQKEGYIVLEDINPSIEKLMGLIQEDEKLSKWFISPEDALTIMNGRTLAVVVDTHKASMLAEPKLVQLASRIVVVDHHRRGEEFIQEPTIIYLEPYASSTCELVTELLQYFNDRISMDAIEATALLAGIVVDTKSFSLRTGARTFEAASFLRRHGADTVIIQHLLKEDLEEYVLKSEIVKHAQMLYRRVALAVAEPGRKYPQLLIAQAADTLLNMSGVEASFVIAERTDGRIGISARSSGQINVQVIMEKLGGGGHLTNAAVQIDCTLAEAERQVVSAIDQFVREEGIEE